MPPYLSRSQAPVSQLEVLFLLLPEGDFWLGTEIFSSPEAAPQQNYALRSPSPASASLKSPAPATQMWSAFRARVHPPIWQLGAQERTRKQRRRSCGAESKWGLLRETGYHVRQAAIGGKGLPGLPPPPDCWRNYCCPVQQGKELESFPKPDTPHHRQYLCWVQCWLAGVRNYLENHTMRRG